MSEHTFRAQGPGGTPADPLDAFFDGDLDEAGARRLFAALRADVRAAEDFVQTQRAVAALREPVEGPDVADAVLERLRRSGVVRSRPRWTWMNGGRLAAGLGLIMGVGAIVLLDRLTHAPATVARAPGPGAPVITPSPEAPLPALAAAPNAGVPTRAPQAWSPGLRVDVSPRISLAPSPPSPQARSPLLTGGAGDLWLVASGSDWARGVPLGGVREPGDALLSIPALPAGTLEVIRLPGPR